MERRVLPMELRVGDRLADERDRHWVGAYAVARDAVARVGALTEGRRTTRRTTQSIVLQARES